MRAALEAVASGQSGAAWPTWRVRLHRRRGLAAAAGSVLALLIIAAALFGLDVGGVRSRVVGGAAGPVRVIKLAVLPFANLSGDPDAGVPERRADAGDDRAARAAASRRA